MLTSGPCWPEWAADCKPLSLGTSTNVPQPEANDWNDTPAKVKFSLRLILFAKFAPPLQWLWWPRPKSNPISLLGDVVFFVAALNLVMLAVFSPRSKVGWAKGCFWQNSDSYSNPLLALPSPPSPSTSAGRIEPSERANLTTGGQFSPLNNCDFVQNRNSKRTVLPFIPWQDYQWGGSFLHLGKWLYPFLLQYRSEKRENQHCFVGLTGSVGGLENLRIQLAA